jgi:hypothetical protein
MAIIHVTEATVGAPNSGRISGTAGDLYAMLKYALPLNGWAVEYDDAVNFRAVFRPGTGNRFRLYVNDLAADTGSAGLCIVRGCENATGTLYANLVDPFPTQAQIADANSNWVKSSAVSATARAFDIWVGETWVKYAVNWGGTTNVWELHQFGDFAPSLSGDSYNTFCYVRNSAVIGGSAIWLGTGGLIANGTGASAAIWLARTYDGTVKSVRSGVLVKLGQNAIGAISSSINASLSGPTSGLDYEKCNLYDSGSGSGTVSASEAIICRGWIPNLLLPQNGGRGTINTRDDFTNSATGLTIGKVVCGANAATSGFVGIQESDDWTPPSG